MCTEDIRKADVRKKAIWDAFIRANNRCGQWMPEDYVRIVTEELEPVFKAVFDVGQKT